MQNKMLLSMFITTDNEYYLFYPKGKNNTGYQVDEQTKKAIIKSYQYYFIILFLAMIILGYINDFLPLLLILTIPIFYKLIIYLYCNNGVV